MDTEEAGGSGDEDLVLGGDVVSELMLQGSESSSCCAEQRPRRRTLDPEARAADDMIDMLGGKEEWGCGLDGARERWKEECYWRDGGEEQEWRFGGG